jgi:hypothetical protein
LLESVGFFSEDPPIVTAEEYHLWIKLAQAGNKMYFIKEMLGQYRIHSGNQSGSVMRQLNADLRVFNEFLPKENLYSLEREVRVRRRYCIVYYGAGRAMHRNGKFEQSWTLLFR